MGAVAEIIKQAGELETALERKAFRERLKSIGAQLEEPTTAGQDIARMAAPPTAGGFNLPTSGQESTRRALKWIGITGATAAAAGAILRALRAARENALRQRLVRQTTPYGGVPTREIHVPVIAKSAEAKEAASMWPLAALAAAPAAARAAGTHISDVAGEAAESAKDVGSRLFEAGGSPWHKPWFLPALLFGTVAAGAAGYKGLGGLFDKLRKRRVARDIAAARGEFESALKAQQEQASLAGQSGVKYSSLSAAVADVLAEANSTGELQYQIASLTKEAGFDPGKAEKPWYTGKGSAVLGAYLAALAATAALGGYGGYRWVKGREEKRKKHQAAAEYLRRRRLAEPPRVIVEPSYA
jgi:hypothetical protein